MLAKLLHLLAASLGGILIALPVLADSYDDQSKPFDIYETSIGRPLDQGIVYTMPARIRGHHVRGHHKHGHGKLAKRGHKVQHGHLKKTHAGGHYAAPERALTRHTKAASKHPILVPAGRTRFIAPVVPPARHVPVMAPKGTPHP